MRLKCPAVYLNVIVWAMGLCLSVKTKAAGKKDVDKMPKFFVKATLDRIFCDAHIQKVLSIKNFASFLMCFFFASRYVDATTIKPFGASMILDSNRKQDLSFNISFTVFASFQFLYLPTSMVFMIGCFKCSWLGCCTPLMLNF